MDIATANQGRGVTRHKGARMSEKNQAAIDLINEWKQQEPDCDCKEENGVTSLCLECVKMQIEEPSIPVSELREWCERELEALIHLRDELNDRSDGWYARECLINSLLDRFCEPSDGGSK